MKKVGLNLLYASIALATFAFAFLAPSFIRESAASAIPQWYAKGTELRGLVVGVTDGDTLKLLTDDQHELRVRLAEIDAPEKGQAYGDVAKRSLSDLAYDKPATVRVTDTDRFGRIVGRVFVGTLDVNMAQVGRGLAWANIKYLSDQRVADLEHRARDARIGLWADSRQPEPPWEYRHESADPTARP